MPRIQKVELAPGSPERCTEITPGQLAGQVVGDFGRRHPDVVDRDRGDRPHDAGILLRAVSHDDHFVEFVAGREFDHLGKVG